jgi:hypothetical protein
MTAPIQLELEVSVSSYGLEVSSVAPLDAAGQQVAVEQVPTPTVVLAAVPGAQGIQGLPGLPGTGAPVVGETMSGVVNGVNTVFTTANIYRTATTAVYRNGIREQRGTGYLETNPTTITFTTAPLTSDTIFIDYTA